MPGGRPSKLTDELVEELCTMLTEGKPLKACCDKVGIDDSTFRKWRIAARNGDPAFQEFFTRVTRARAEGELLLWGIAVAGDTQGTANGQAKCAQWALGKLNPNRYAERLNVRLEEGLELLLSDVERICSTKDCGCFEAIITSLAAREAGEREAPSDPSGEEADRSVH